MARADLPALHIRPVRDRPLPSEQEVASAPAASRSRSHVATYRRDRSPLCRLVTLSAFSLLSFAGRIAGIASRLPLARLPGLILHAFERASIEPALRDSKLTEDVGPRVRIRLCSSGESVSRVTYLRGSRTPAFRAGLWGCVPGAVGREPQGPPTSHQPAAISLSGHIPVPHFRRRGRDELLAKSSTLVAKRGRAFLGAQGCWWILRGRTGLKQSRARSADRTSLAADGSARAASALSDRAVGGHRESLG